jgi:hypothetical protein
LIYSLQVEERLIKTTGTAMKNSFGKHTFHIPVMGIGFTIDTPAKVAPYGISSAISLVDDILMEKMRKFYCLKLDFPFQAISSKIDDFRAKRITAYLDLMDKIVKEKFEELKESYEKKHIELAKYIEMLPDAACIKEKFQQFLHNHSLPELKKWIQENLTAGSIDVNIMTKLDKDNFRDGLKLSQEHNDAHAALRGFAQSSLNSSIVLSAGMNPRLYSYIEEFEDFYPDETGFLKKKIILKVSDYRSALIQGKFLAKKGLWVSEYRVESGLNCGGHAFATQGNLLGPILEEFKNTRDVLVNETHQLYVQSLKTKKRIYPEMALNIRITAQGGVGTADEHNFLLDYYGLDSIGWGTPFLLVPEVTNVDPYTLNLLKDAKEEDLYLSNISPLGVPFNSLRGNTKDFEKQSLIDKGIYGSPCVKKYASLNNEFTDKSICTASRQYQGLKLKELDAKNLGADEHDKEFAKIVDKSCICVGLGTSVLLVNGVESNSEGAGVSICPGPNMAYFSDTLTLKGMVDHIYGRTNVIHRTDRPHMFVNELKMYVEYLKERIAESPGPLSEKQKEYFQTFKNNVNEGIEYYKQLFTTAKAKLDGMRAGVMIELDAMEQKLSLLEEQFTNFRVLVPVPLAK